MDASLGTQDEEALREPTASSGQPWRGAVVMVTETVVEQVVAALARGEAIVAVARAYGLDRKTVRTWGRYGGYRPRARRPTVSQLDPFRTWMHQRAPEVGFNAAVVCRELRELGFVWSSVIVRRALHPLRIAATLVMTLGYSRRCFAVAFPRQRLHEWLAGHELAFQHFGGVTDTIVVDNAKAMVLRHTRDATTWHPTYADFAGYYGFRPWACAPYRPQTKGKVE